MGPFCHANATHSPPRASLPPRPLLSSCALPSSGAATRCSILVPGGVPRDPLSPDRRGGISIHHDSGRENLANFDTKGAEGGKDKGIVSTRELFLSEWRRCAERRRERKREILASRLRSTRLSIRPPFNKGRFTTKKNSNVSFSVS